MNNDTEPALGLAFQASIRSKSRSLVLLESLKLNVLEDVRKFSDSELSRELFFGGSATISATLGDIHIDLPKGQVHGSTSYALKKIIEHIGFAKSTSASELGMSKIEGSIAVLGGPVSTLHSRLVLGCGGPSPLLGRTLPITFDCRVNARYYSSTIEAEPWRVIVDGRISRKECLVITSIPLGPSGERLVVFSGLRGAGTQAIELVLADRSLLDRLYKDTRNFVAWQALIEVHSKDDKTAHSLGTHRVYEIRNIDFSDPGKLVRDNLVLTPDQIDNLIAMLPPKKRIDLSDPIVTSVIHFRSHKLWKARNRETNAERNADQQLSQDLPSSRSASRTTVEALENEGPSKPLSLPVVSPRRRGRPPLPKSDMSLTRRFQVFLSERDLKMIDEIMTATEAGSMGSVVRQAIHRAHAQFVSAPHAPGHRKKK